MGMYEGSHSYAPGLEAADPGDSVTVVMSTQAK